MARRLILLHLERIPRLFNLFIIGETQDVETAVNLLSTDLPRGA